MENKALNTSFNFFKDTLWKAFHKDAAKMLIAMGAAGFAFSSMAQCFAIKINDKIDNKKKRFLLRQEAADGAINIGLFLTITSSVWKFSDKILKALGFFNIRNESGKLIKSEIKKVRSGGRIATTMIASVLACNVVTPFVRNLIAGKITALKDKKDQKNAVSNINISPFNEFNKWSNRPNVSFKRDYKSEINKNALNYPKNYVSVFKPIANI